MNLDVTPEELVKLYKTLSNPKIDPVLKDLCEKIEAMLLKVVALQQQANYQRWVKEQQELITIVPSMMDPSGSFSV